jgi:PAS domain S-box-containing protein
MSIKTKIILPIILTIISMLSIATYYSYVYNKKIAKKEIIDNLHEITYLRSHSLDNFLEKEIDILKIVSARKEVTNEELAVIKDSDDGIDEIFLLNSSGKIIKSSDEHRIGENRSNDEYFINASKYVYIKDAYLSNTTKVPSMAFSTIYNQGVLVMRINLDKLQSTVSRRIGLKNTGEVYIMNKDGYTISPLLFSENTFLKTRLESEAAKECLNLLKTRDSKETLHEEASQFDIYKNYRGIDVVGQYHTSHLMDWCILGEMDESEAMARANALFEFSIIRMILVMVMLSFVSIYLLAKFIILPLKKLQSAIKIITNGNFDHKIINNSKDEFGQLSRSFNKMALVIKDNRAQIDEKVKLQTQKIIDNESALKNQQLATLNVLEDVQKEKKRAIIEQEKLKAILEGIGDGVFVVDKNYKILIFNKVASLISGFTEQEALGKNYKKVLKFIYEKNSKENDKFVVDAINLGVAQKMANHTCLIKKNGKLVSVADSASPIKDADENVVGCVVVFRDITEERTLNQAKSSFISTASHQLRTPLTGIRWLSEILLKDSSLMSKENKQYVIDINLSSERLAKLIDELLDISRIEGKKKGVKEKDIDITSFIEEYLLEIKTLLKIKEIELTLVNNAKGEKIITDQSALKNIIHSLVSNAIEYTPKKGKININVGIDKKENSLLFEIKDNGIGIPYKNQETIFEKFTRGDNANQAKVSGTGLGLYIVKNTVKMLNGSVRFESDVNKGTTFYIALPLKPKIKNI